MNHRGSGFRVPSSEFVTRKSTLAFVVLAALACGCASLPKPYVRGEAAPAPRTPEPPAAAQFSLAPPQATAADEGPLTVEQCVRLALERSPRSRAARAGVSVAEEAVGEARSAYYPEVAFNAAYSRFQRHAFLPGGLAVPRLSSVIGPEDDWSAALRARLLLFDTGRRPSLVSAARARLGAAAEDSEALRQDLSLAVHEAFNGLAAAQEGAGAAGENLTRAEDHLRLAKERKEAGAVARADVVRAEVEAANGRLSLAQARNRVRLARGALNTLLAFPVEAETRIAARPAPTSPPEELDVARALDRALRARPELRAAQQRLEAARSGIEGAKSAFGPKVLADGGYGRHDSAFFPEDQEWSVGVSLEWPLFSGFATAHGVARARAELAREMAEADRRLLEVRKEVWEANSRLQEAYEAVRTAEVLVKDAGEGLRLTRERYQEGAGTLTDLLDAQAALAGAEASRTAAHWRYEDARAALRWSQGEPAGEEIEP